LWLALEAWSGERNVSPEATDGPDGRPWVAFRRGLITNLLNPKAAVFYMAVLPEFIQADGRPLFAQTLLLSIVYVGIATLVHSGIVAMAGALQTTVAGAGHRRTIRRALAMVLVGIAIWFALTTGRSR
jgi:threonine/homoserine/homoserine lactone efflux protein